MATEAQSAAARRGAEVTNAKRRAAMEAEGRQPRPKGEPRECACGCGDMTKGGTFIMGHDARHKSNLIKIVMSIPDRPAGIEALAELEARGWTKFLEKSKEVAARPKVARERKAKAPVDEEQSAAERMQSLNDLKEAKRVLESHGIKRNNSVTRFNYQAILGGTYPFDTLGWVVGQHCRVEMAGIMYDGNITEIAGERARVQYDNGTEMVERVFELASLQEPAENLRRANATPGVFR